MARHLFGVTIDFASGSVPKSPVVICTDAAATVAADILTLDKVAPSVAGTLVHVANHPISFYGPDNVGQLYVKPTTAATVYPLKPLDDQIGNAKAAKNVAFLSYLGQTTVGAGGAASPLPSAPSLYLNLVDVTGAVYVIPAYAAS